MRREDRFTGTRNTVDPEATIPSGKPVFPIYGTQNPVPSASLILILGFVMVGRRISDLEPFVDLTPLTCYDRELECKPDIGVISHKSASHEFQQWPV
jgi:hypothetical protein